MRNNERKISARRLSLGVAFIALAATPLHAQAQETLDPVPDDTPAAADTQTGVADNDIVVTARRTAERLQDVPVAVTALGGDALDDRAVATLDEIARYAPNIRFDGAAQLSGGNYNATVFIRGVGSNDFAIFSDPGVGFYVDDVYYARSIGGVMDAIDIDSVQVLRGPQGTLFGKNTVGGAVLITTAQPELGEFSGKAEIFTGSYDRLDVRGAINLPIGDKAAIRISGATLNRDGYVRRLFDGGTMGNRNADMLRIKLRVQPTDTLTIDIGGDYTRARENSAPSDLLAVGNAPGITGIPFLRNYNQFVAPTRGIIAPNGQPTLNPSFITDSPFESWAGGPNRNDLDLWGVQGTIAWEIGGATLKSITAYRDMEAFFTRDGDNTPFTFRETQNDDRQWQFSQELQLAGRGLNDRLSYVIGAFYFREEAEDIARADLAIGLDPPLPPPFSPAVFPNNFTKNTSLAGYAQVGYDLTDQLTVEVGGRYSRETKNYRSLNIRQRDNFTFIDVTREATFEKFTPRFGINYKAARDVLLYASYSQGFKQGGFNGRPLVSAAEVTRYEPETLDSYEIGLKSQWLDRALTLNVAAFHSIYKDIQLTVNETPVNFVANAAAGEINGIELEIVARPASWFAFNAGVGYIDARYTEVGEGLGPTQILPITLNSGFVKAPEWTVTSGVEFRHDFDNGSEIVLRGDVSMYSEIFNDVANTPIVTEPGYVLANARLAYTLPGNAITLAAFVTNLTDALYKISGNASGAFGLAEAAYGRPREWGLSASFAF
ncbi:TonB-dependent receptor [Sphingomonas baiyangensis]|uniref:TonB-dependent receptor n=1 Tax=Sphingomonas baiyangensis TaxID=2572576 RepID=A0A4U1L7V5_9SPHN|nr:TonB-dependent receptor [Sphingomonas baiyangensis]TKD53032.1 TonB-dependent receptor [Sphingomonas baiyangensis]